MISRFLNQSSLVLQPHGPPGLRRWGCMWIDLADLASRGPCAPAGCLHTPCTPPATSEHHVCPGLQLLVGVGPGVRGLSGGSSGDPHHWEGRECWLVGYVSLQQKQNRKRQHFSITGVVPCVLVTALNAFTTMGRPCSGCASGTQIFSSPLGRLWPGSGRWLRPLPLAG